MVYKLRKKKVLETGLLRKSLLKRFGIKQDVYYADLNWGLILELLKDHKTKYKEVSKYPAVRRDLALLLDKKVAFSELEALALRTDKNLLKEVKLFDVYEGDKLACTNDYSIGFHEIIDS